MSRKIDSSVDGREQAEGVLGRLTKEVAFWVLKNQLDFEAGGLARVLK